MSEQPPKQPQAKPAPISSKMEKIVALCKRRGFIFQSSEIYGGINGFWDYGPLGNELKRNLKNAWWHDIVRCPARGPDNELLEMVGLDCTIIMNPKVWVASGHVGGFSDAMVADREEHGYRCRADKCWTVGFYSDVQKRDFAEQSFGTGEPTAEGSIATEKKIIEHSSQNPPLVCVAVEADSQSQAKIFAYAKLNKQQRKHLDWVAEVDRQVVEKNLASDSVQFLVLIEAKSVAWTPLHVPSGFPVLSPATQKATLTEPRQFNLMFESHAGPVQDEANKVYLRPETAQGIFANFRNVVDTSRVKIPFGIAQQGKAFRNEVTPRNFTFRSREFEQMEIEFFIRPPQSCGPGDLTPNDWYKFWRDSRFAWWQSIGLSSANLQLREHDRDELAHYAKEGAGTSDIEYKFPFTDPGFGELEGVAHRADFDLKAHAQHSGLGDKLKYFDQDLQVKLMAAGVPKEEIDKQCKYFPHVIEPSAGADRGTLALLCEAYTDDESRPSGVVMKFHPRMAPVKAAIFPLVDKDGMPEIAAKLHDDLRKTWNVQTDNKQSIGKRYARMDEAGTPFCFTIDTQTLQDQTVTVRHRDTLAQERINLSQVRAFLAEKIDGAT